MLDVFFMWVHFVWNHYLVFMFSFPVTASWGRDVAAFMSAVLCIMPTHIKITCTD